MKRREKNYIEIGETFEENTKLKNDYYFINRIYYYKDLYECYQKPSDAKRYIYNKYEKMLQDNTDAVLDYGIQSYNSMIIILHALIKKDNKYYYLKITPSHNYYMEMGF